MHDVNMCDNFTECRIALPARGQICLSTFEKLNSGCSNSTVNIKYEFIPMRTAAHAQLLQILYLLSIIFL